MFRDVTECSGMFHVPGFIDAYRKSCICVFKGAKQFLTQGVSTRSYHLSTLDVNF